MAFDERFAGPDLDPAIWTTSYLPQWSSRAASAATYAVADGELRLTIPPEQPLWCPDLHEPALRVSAVQSANWSGPLGSSRGMAPFRPGLVVREQQPSVLGFVPLHGRVEVACRARLSPRSMFSAWMIGLEDEPERCGEICIVEVFGDEIEEGRDGTPTVALGCGVHQFRDPGLAEDFAAPRVALDVAEPHVYAVDWTPDGVAFMLDGEVVRTTAQSPAYPLMLILGVFDFPDRDASDSHGAHGPASAAAPHTPQLAVSRVRWRPL